MKIIKDHIAYIFVFTVSLAISYLYIGQGCSMYTVLHFDSQELLTWDFLISLDKIPYKDFYYPYGLFMYLRNNFFIFYFIYLLLFPILIVTVFTFFKKIFITKNLLYTSTFLYFLFILIITGIESFVRYGILLGFSLVFSMLFAKSRLTSKYIILIGFVIGIIFSIQYDIAIYTTFLFISSIVFFPLLNFNILTLKNRKYYTNILIDLIYFAIGLVIPLLLLSMFLLKINFLNEFLVNISKLNEIAIYAKTPFFHSLRTPGNLFIIISLFSASFYIAYLIYFQKLKNTLLIRAIILTFLSLLILQQKSIIRVMDGQLTFIALMLVIILFYEIKPRIKWCNSFLPLFIYLVFIIGSILVLKPELSKQRFNGINSFSHNNNRSCVDENVKRLTRDSDFNLLKNKINLEYGYKGNIFSFPGDPLIYTFFNTKIPYYLSLYESSPLHAQERSIRFIKENDVKYIIYDSTNYSIQDGVPNYIRGAELNSYILNNFRLKEKVSKYYILERSSRNFDFFKSNIFDRSAEFRKYIFDIDLDSIPLSEGQYKYKYLNQNDNKKLISGTKTRVNSYLMNNNISSDKLFLVLNPKEKLNKKNSSFLKINTQDGYSTSVMFKNCSNNPCIINISKIPLFYKIRLLKQIDISDEIKNISLVYVKNKGELW